MARPRGFNEEQALDTAMRAFWREGYDHVSYDDLVGETRASRNGLYSAFGDKKQLFIKSLDLYREAVDRQMLTPLREGSGGLEDIRRLFAKMISRLDDPHEQPGCFACAVAFDPIARDIDVRRAIEPYFDAALQSFEAALERSKALGEIAPGADTHALAQYLVGMVQAVSAIVRSDIRRDQASTYVELALSVFD